METPPTDKEIRVNALRFAGNNWRRFGSYKRRFLEKYGASSPAPTPAAFYNNRLLEDTYAKQGDANPLPHGKSIEVRQKLADPLVAFRASLKDPSEFDKIFAESLARRMPGHKVEVSKAMSASTAVHEKDSIRTFVTKLT